MSFTSAAPCVAVFTQQKQEIYELTTSDEVLDKQSSQAQYVTVVENGKVVVKESSKDFSI
jgi:sulfur carrier protein ThiS